MSFLKKKKKFCLAAKHFKILLLIIKITSRQRTSVRSIPNEVSCNRKIFLSFSIDCENAGQPHPELNFALELKQFNKCSKNLNFCKII